MKRKIVLFVVLGIGTIGFGAGTLTPQGAPAPTMKTLDEIDQSISNTTAAVKIAEPRTPLIEGASGVIIDGNGTIYINQSGSYYLTTNLTVSFGNGIVVSTNGVTVDLNGFTIRSTAATPGYSGIEIGASHVSVFNGHIESRVVYDSSANDDQFTGSGFQHGIRAPLSSYSSIRIRNISVSGCDLNGIYILTQDSLVESCTVRVVGNCGIMAGVVKNCSAITCGGVAVNGTQIIDCRGDSTGSYGILSLGTVANSYGYGSVGIYASQAVQNSYGFSLKGDGILANIASYSYGRSNGPASWADGIQAAIAIGCIAEGGENITHKYLMP